MAGGDHIELAPGHTLPASAIDLSYARSGGPGGQHVNKTSTKALLSVALADLQGVLPGDAVYRLRTVAKQYLTEDDRLVIHADETRSQVTNRRAAIEKLQQLCRAALKKPKRRKPTKPSRGAKRRRLDTKRQRGETKSRRQTPFKR
jgi:ribosome-associated protein